MYIESDEEINQRLLEQLLAGYETVKNTGLSDGKYEIIHDGIHYNINVEGGVGTILPNYKGEGLND